MKDLVVRLKLRVRHSDGSRPLPRFRPLSHCKMKLFFAVVDGKAVHHPEGADFPRYAKTAGANFCTPCAERESNSQLKD